MSGTRYDSIELGGNALADTREYRERAESLASFLEGTVPASRARSVALTKLQEFVMWATRARAEYGAMHLFAEDV